MSHVPKIYYVRGLGFGKRPGPRVSPQMLREVSVGFQCVGRNGLVAIRTLFFTNLKPPVYGLIWCHEVGAGNLTRNPRGKILSERPRLFHRVEGRVA